MLYDLDTLKSLDTGEGDFYFVPSRFRQAREWFTKNAERCRASYDPAKSGPEITSDRGMANLGFCKFDYVQGVFIYKNHNGWHSDVMFCDGDDVQVLGTATKNPCKTRHEANSCAEDLLHSMLACEDRRATDGRKAARFDWNAIWRCVIAALQSLQDRASYPIRMRICLDELDNQNDHQFLLDIHSRVPVNLIAEALEEWEHRVQNGYKFTCLSRDREGRDNCGIALFEFGNTCFILICNFTDADAPILHLRTYNVPAHEYEYAAQVENLYESLQDEFPFMRIMN